jgi:dihydrodipicolinate synthase/N-acetylneuraminate lyase
MAALGLCENDVRLPLAPIAEPEDEALLECARE